MRVGVVLHFDPVTYFTSLKYDCTFLKLPIVAKSPQLNRS